MLDQNNGLQSPACVSKNGQPGPEVKLSGETCSQWQSCSHSRAAQYARAYRVNCSHKYCDFAENFMTVILALPHPKTTVCRILKARRN